MNIEIISGSRNNKKCMLHIECSHESDGFIDVKGSGSEIAAMLVLLIRHLREAGMPEILIMRAVADALAEEAEHEK